MSDIKITKEQLEELVKFINTIPTAYGLPLVQFFGQLQAEQTPKEELKED
jgi:hypothetical protein